NDGWFGKSAGPWQHLAQMRLRSIESGAPTARVANTGISAVIDAYGRETFLSQPDTIGAYDMLLPKNSGSTIYGQWRDLLLVCLLFLGIALGEVTKRL
ncbi:MAG: nitrilase-related carbon-nitrogen hydrolase, partial [Aestuariivirga sp.]